MKNGLSSLRLRREPPDNELRDDALINLRNTKSFNKLELRFKYLNLHHNERSPGRTTLRNFADLIAAKSTF